MSSYTPNLLLIFFFLITLLISISSLYSPTPIGHMLSKCIHSIPSNSIVERERLNNNYTGNVIVYHESYKNGNIKINKCDTTENTLIRKDKDNIKKLKSNGKDLPADYDGWLAYTAFNNSITFDLFNGNFTVPTAPINTPDLLYIFTGLQNVNWIPKVMPEDDSFDIIQPVLQYPGDYGNYWSIKSWYVTLDVGYLVSDEIQINAGDYVYGVMERKGSDSWYIGSTVGSSGQTTSITATQTRLTTQTWAYTTVECYGCQDCNTFPTNELIFEDMIIKCGSKSITPVWDVTPYKPAQTYCKEHATLGSNGDIYYSFQN